MKENFRAEKIDPIYNICYNVYVIDDGFVCHFDADFRD